MYINVVSNGMMRAVMAATLACGPALWPLVSSAETAGDGREPPVVAFDSMRRQRQDRAFTIPYPRPVERGRYLISIDHRTFQPLDENPGGSLLGFDSGNLKIGLGVRRGILDELDAGLARFNGTTDDIDAYEFDGRYELTGENDGMADLAVVAGFAWFDGASGTNDFPFFMKVIAGKTVWKRAYASAGIAHHALSRAPGKTAGDDDYSAAAVATFEAALRPSVSLATECSFPIAGFDAGAPAWSVGAKFRTHGHAFSVLLSNTQNISSDGIVAGSDRWGHPVVGFTITRKIGSG